MKTIILTGIVMLTAFSLTSCKKDNTTPSTKQTLSHIEDGTWKITLFNDSGKDEMYHFQDYTFKFSDGIISVTGSGNSISGSYSISESGSKVKLVMSFGASSPFDELNDDWNVLESTPEKIRLEDVSGGNGGTDILTFEKI